MLQGTRARLTAAVILLLILAAVVVGIQQYRQRNPPLPAPDSPRYAEMVSAFYTGLLAMQVGDPDHGPKNLLLATQIVPQEPAPYADMGLYELRLNNVTQAQQFLDKARNLAPDSGPIEALLGLLSRHNGQYAEAIRHFQRAIQLDPNDLRARYSLVEAVGQQAGPDTDAQTQQQLEAILKVQPRNAFVQIELGRLAARTGNADLLRRMASQITALPSWTAEARQQLQTVRSDAAKGGTRQAATDLTILSHLLVETPEYLRDERAVQDDPTNVGVPIDHFLRLPPPSPLPAPADTSVSFTPLPLGEGQGRGSSAWASARSAFLGPDTPAATILANGRTVQVTPGGSVPFPGGPTAMPPTPDGVLPVNWNNEFDFKVGMVLAGAGGVRLFRPQPGVGFADVTAQSTLPAAVVNGAYTGVWAEDMDSDGDLDLVLGAAHGPPTVLRNNGSATAERAGDVYCPAPVPRRTACARSPGSTSTATASRTPP